MCGISGFFNKNSNKIDERVTKISALAIKNNIVAMKIGEITITVNQIDAHAPLLHPPAAPQDHATRKNPF